MQIVSVKAIVSKDGTITIKRLPFPAGDQVEVIVRSQAHALQSGQRYPLRGKPIRYAAPFESVAEDDWHLLQ